ncbi:MAG: hypothetical protein R3F56_20100 [Planctomycetota bacterium]
MPFASTLVSRTFAAFSVTLCASLAGQVVLVEGGHVLIKHVDSTAPLHPSQTLLETTLPVGDIESIAYDPTTRGLLVQLLNPPLAAPGVTTHIFRVALPGGVVTPLLLNSGFAINERGTDMEVDLARNVLVTQDMTAPVPERLVTVNLATGVPGIWSLVTPPIFSAGTFGMDFSQGAGGSVVPPGDIVFTSDVAAGGIHSATFAGPGSITHVPVAALPGGGDDLVIQPAGNWVWVGDFNSGIISFAPFPPHAATASPLALQAMFTASALPFIAGSRAAVCDVTGTVYVSYSGTTGGTGIFRINPALNVATLVLTIGMPGHTEGLQDLIVAPSSFGPGNSVYFTVHDTVSGGEEVWEVSATACCSTMAAAVSRPDVPPLNAPASLFEVPLGTTPQLGNAAFAVRIDDPGNACAITVGSPTVLFVAAAPGLLPVPRLGCAPGAAGNVQIALAPPPITLGFVPWGGPGIGATYPLPVPFDSLLCNLRLYTQGIWFDPLGPGGPLTLTWALDLVLGS